MSKRNVIFTKGNEPEFLKRLKQEAGYKEGPTVDTKRERLPQLDDNDEEILDDQPLVVVLKPGDLSAEEVERVKKEQIEKEEKTKADLSKRVIFKPRRERDNTSQSELEPVSTEKKKRTSEKKGSSSPKSKKSGAGKTPGSLLSFDENDEQEE